MKSVTWEMQSRSSQARELSGLFKAHLAKLDRLDKRNVDMRDRATRDVEATSRQQVATNKVSADFGSEMEAQVPCLRILFSCAFSIHAQTLSAKARTQLTKDKDRVAQVAQENTARIEHARGVLSVARVRLDGFSADMDASFRHLSDVSTGKKYARTLSLHVFLIHSKRGFQVIFDDNAKEMLLRNSCLQSTVAIISGGDDQKCFKCNGLLQRADRKSAEGREPGLYDLHYQVLCFHDSKTVDVPPLSL